MRRGWGRGEEKGRRERGRVREKGGRKKNVVVP